MADAPKDEGAAGAEAEEEKPPRSMKSTVVKSGALTSLSMGAWEIAANATGSKFGITRIMKLGSGAHGAVIAPVAYVSETKIEQGDSFRGALNKIREQHGRMSEQNDVLSGNIDYLNEETARMKECAGALREIANQQQADLERLNELIEENKKIAKEMRKILVKKRIEEIVSIVIECDSDMDFRLTGKDVDILLMQLDQYEDLNLDTETIQRTLANNDGDMRMALQVIYRLLPKEYNDGEDDDGEYTPYDAGATFADAANENRSAVSNEQSGQMKHLLSDGDNPVLALLSLQDPRKDAIDFLKDDPKTMTRGRKIALTLMRFKIYYPLSDGESKLPKIKPIKGDSDDDSEEGEKPFRENPNDKSIRSKTDDDPNMPSLEKAWAFFEHNTLPRYIFEPKPDGWERPKMMTRVRHKLSKANKQMDRAEPGEMYQKTVLYSPRDTPLTQMGDFGIGVGLYFSTLRFLSLITFVAGLLNLFKMKHYASDEYSDGQPGVNFFVRGSAICTRTEWVICDSCNNNSTNISPNRLGKAIGTINYFGNGTNGTESFELNMALKNDCPAPKITSAILSFATLCLMIIGILIMDLFQRNMEVKFDEDEQTTQDYSIVINDPPPDAKDPQEWKDFFESHYDDVHVTCCTVGLNNAALLQALVTRRELLQRIRFKLPIGTKLDHVSLEKTILEIKKRRNCLQKLAALFTSGAPEWFYKMKYMESLIAQLSRKEYKATAVFITFETESAQRKVLASMSNHEYNFRDDHKITVDEAAEPSSVRWQFLDVRKRDKFKIILMTTSATIFGLVLAAVAVIIMKQRRLSAAPFVIAICNQAFPKFALFLTYFEKHGSRDSLEVSLYIKIVVFRWVNTAIVTTIASDFTETLEKDGLIPGVFSIFIAEILTTNVIQLLDIGGNIKRHFVAPRAQTQEQMNNCMMGVDYYIAERYTNVTKILFLALWYSAIFPATYFLCSIALLINYFSDRFSLMRTWRQIGKIGAHISVISRQIFCTLALLGFAVNGSYLWAGFPFDNLCKSDVNWTDYNNHTFNISVSNLLTKQQYQNKNLLINETYLNQTFNLDPVLSTYKYCDQDMIKYSDAFPPLPQFQKSKWMTYDQELVVYFFSFTTLVILGLMVLVIFIRFIQEKCCGGSSFEFVGEDQNIAFSTLETQCGYIPEVQSQEIPYPLVACDLKAFDHDLFEWSNPELPYEFYDLTEDVKFVFRTRKEDIDVSRMFSSIIHTPPE